MYWALYLTCYAAGGWEPTREGLNALRNRSLDVDLLMVVAALGAASIGQIFDGSLLIVIFATSGALEDVATTRTQNSVRKLLDLAPSKATRIQGEQEDLVPTKSLQPGDTIVIRPGENIGADGVVISGSSDVDQSTITGESIPADKVRDSQVFAGTLNGSGVLTVRVTHDPSTTVLARITEMVTEASETKAKTQLFIEKIEQRYSIGVVAATLAVFSIPLLIGESVTQSLLRAMTFMIVASPCAIVLATMPPLLSAMANSGNHGVLIKAATTMEKLADVSRVAFDKTGTLTHGKPEVAAIVPFGCNNAADVLTYAAAAESSSEHPLGRAIARHAGDTVEVAPATHFSAIPGIGVQAVVGSKTVLVTKPGFTSSNTEWAATRDPDTEAEMNTTVTNLQKQGMTVVVTSVDGYPIGALGLRDGLRVDAVATVDRITAASQQPPLLLTGDNLAAATRTAADAGVDEVHADLLPHHKAAIVTQQQLANVPMLVIGDGINDAPALAAAHVGAAMGRVGSDLALATADIVIVRDELSVIPTVMELSRRARRIVTANLVIAGSFVAVLVVWDLAGHLPLPLGVAGHEGSTVIVGLNGLRLLTTEAWNKASKVLRKKICACDTA